MRGGEIGRRLRAARAYGGYSQPQIAQVLEVSVGTVKNIELGERSPKRSELLAVAEACGVPMWFLEDGWAGRREDDQEVDDLARVALGDLRSVSGASRRGGAR